MSPCWHRMVFEVVPERCRPVSGTGHRVCVASCLHVREVSATSVPSEHRLPLDFSGCQFKTAYGMKDMERHLKIHTGERQDIS